MAAMMWMIINFNNLLIMHIIAFISWPPPLISQLVHPDFLKAAPFLYSLAVLIFSSISLLFCKYAPKANHKLTLK